VLDGWWGEGYEGDNGWAIKPASGALEQGERDREEALTLYEILLDRVIPLYYKRESGGYPAEWIGLAKRSMASILPRFNSARMLGEYVTKFYQPASKQGRRYQAAGAAREIAAWKARVREAWPKMHLRCFDHPRRRLEFGDSMRLAVGASLNGLDPADVTIELLLWRGAPAQDGAPERFEFAPAGAGENAGEQRYELELKPEFCGRLEYRIRMYPRHELLTHPFELGLMLWV
jgi:starch phosphorylase